MAVYVGMFPRPPTVVLRRQDALDESANSTM
jgi:hypothetical protein